MPLDAELFGTLFAAIQTVLGLDDKSTLEIIKKRFKNCESFLKAFLEVDEIADILEEDELVEMLDEREQDKKNKSLAKQFAKSYKAKRREVYGEPPKVGSKNHPLYGLKYIVKFPEDGDSQISQKDATKMLPPGASIWVGHASSKRKGCWCSHYPPFERHSITWEAAGSERLAVLDNVHHTWKLFLTDKGLPTSHCPIQGLFE